MRFSGKKVFVTGASRGIGKAIAKAFREEGAWVIGTSTTVDNKNDEVCQEWRAANFTDASQVKACAEFLKQAKPDVLINNAGINKIASFVEIYPDDFLQIQQVNVFALGMHGSLLAEPFAVWRSVSAITYLRNSTYEKERKCFPWGACLS